MKMVTGCNSNVLKTPNGLTKQRTYITKIRDITLKPVIVIDQGSYPFLCSLWTVLE